ncbi:MAG: hypothetical protein HQM12_00215 [SAR324 cluster bacterium]|nr:hypothetical protein [SAR324 cluster bacterium]MBF0351298.1 hypothetical protein [SAR324 cluster bacterium]
MMQDVIVAIEAVIEEMVEFQKKKVLKVANQIDPRLTPEDIRNPQDIPAIYKDAMFNYEDGILTGYLSMQTAVRVKIREMQ